MPDDPNPVPPASTLNQREELEFARLRAETAKINAEAAHANRPLLKSVNFYAAMVPIVLALASLPFSIKLFEAKKTLLDYETLKLTDERSVSSNALFQLSQKLNAAQSALRTAESLRGALTNENQQLRRQVADLRVQRSNEVVIADTTTNRIALVILKELRRVEGERDGLAAINRTLREQLSRPITADSTDSTVDGRRRTEDGTLRRTEDGVLRDSEGKPIRDDSGGIIFTDEKGVPFTQGDGTVFSQGPARPATNAPPKTNAAPRPQ